MSSIRTKNPTTKHRKTRMNDFFCKKGVDKQVFIGYKSVL